MFIFKNNSLLKSPRPKIYFFYFYDIYKQGIKEENEMNFKYIISYYCII